MLLVRNALRQRAFASSSSSTLISLKPALKDLVVDVGKLGALSAEQLDQLWTEYHLPERSANSEVQLTGRTLPLGQFATLRSQAAQSPLFVLPNFRANATTGAMGFCTLYTEFSAKQDFAVMTPLDEYREQGSSATPWLSLSFFSKELDQQQVVLEQTRYNAMKLTRVEAELLANKWIEAYTLPIETANSPFVFNHRSGQFSFEQAFKLPSTTSTTAKK